MKLLEREEIINIIKSNPDYISEGFIQNWIDNIDQKPINERTVSDTLKVDVNSNDEIITKVAENASEIEMAYNTIYADIQGTTICLGEYSYATVVDDMLGTVLYSNPMKFTMKDKKIEFIK